ncbi:MAG: zf-TFIIB domain-containing protein [Pyrinomonadaceae bacterium]
MPIDMEDRGQALENEYFHRKEQELIANLKAKIQDDDAKRLGIKCPKCDGTLIETDFDKIKIDVCDKCSGVWLDAGELTQIADKDEESGWFGKLFG